MSLQDAAKPEAKPGLYLSDAEIRKELGVSEDRWRRAKHVLEGQGLPKVDPLMGGRYWPAVRAFFDRRHGLATVDPAAPDGKENLDAL